MCLLLRMIIRIWKIYMEKNFEERIQEDVKPIQAYTGGTLTGKKKKK